MEGAVGVRTHRGGGIGTSECKRVGLGSQLGRYKWQWAHANEWVRARTDRQGITGATMVGAAAPATPAAAVPWQQQP